MKKLLIASSVMAALSMGAAHADPLTLNGGTIEFIGEITDTTCWVGVDDTSTAGTTSATAGSPTDGGNLVLLPVVAKNFLSAPGDHTGKTKFNIAVRADITGGAEACTLGNIAPRNDDNIPIAGTPVTVSKVRAIFGGVLSATNNTNNYTNPAGTHAAYNYANVDETTGYLNNLVAATGGKGFRDWDDSLGGANGSASNVQLRLLNDDGSVIKVGDATSQMSKNTSAAISTSGTPVKTLLPYAVEYITVAGGATAGMVRSFVTYDLYYE